MMTHTFIRSLDGLDKHIYFMVRSSFTVTGAFPLHACSATRNLRTYFTSVGRAFLVDTARIVDWTVRHPDVERLFFSLDLVIFKNKNSYKHEIS